MKELLVDMKGGKVQNREQLASYIKSLADGRHRFTTEPYQVRSLDQNEYYWGVVVSMVRPALRAAGHNDVHTDKQAHAKMKEHFIHADKSMLQALEEMRFATTTTLSTIQFNSYLEDIFQWAAEYLGIVIPPPLKPKV